MQMFRGLSYDERNAWLLVAPVFAVLMAVALYPIAYSFYTSLYDIVLTRPWRRPFVGTGNYERILAEPQFWVA